MYFKIKLYFIVCLSCITSTLAQNKNNTLITGSYNSIFFEKETYNIGWSHIDKGYYKQEYIRAKDTLEKFNKMITIDVFVTDIGIKDIVNKKINQIEARKGTDPVANYQLIENEQSGEFLLDFLISEGDLYEWNAYRYKTINTNKGKAILLFAYTFRSFEGAELDLDHFFPYLKKNRERLIESVAYYILPTITLRD